MHFYKVNVLFLGEEDLSTQSIIDSSLKKALEGKENAEVVSYEVVGIPDCNNVGRCSKCGTWVSDHALTNAVLEFSDGTVIGGSWFCDICIDEENERRF